MKNLKWITTIALASMMSLTLMACGKTADTGTSSSSSSSVKATVSSSSSSSSASSSASSSDEAAKALAKTVEDNIKIATTKTGDTFDKALITNARNTYNSLTAEEKKSVPAETVKALEDAEAEIARQEQEAQEAAAKAAEEEAARKAQEQKELEEKQRAEAERAAEEARQAEAARRAEEAKQAANTEQPSGGNTGNIGSTGDDAEVGKWGVAPEGVSQKSWNEMNRQTEENFGEGVHIPRPGELEAMFPGVTFF